MSIALWKRADSFQLLGILKLCRDLNINTSIGLFSFLLVSIPLLPIAKREKFTYEAPEPMVCVERVYCGTNLLDQLQR